MQRVISEGKKNIGTPLGETFHNLVLGFVDSMIKRFITFSVTGVETVITRHFKVFIWDVLDEQGDKVQSGDSFFNKDIIFVTVVVKGYILSIVRIDAAESDDRTTEISADIFDDSIRVTEIGFSIHIETVFIFPVYMCFHFFERRSDGLFHFIEKSSLKRHS